MGDNSIFRSHAGSQYLLPNWAEVIRICLLEASLPADIYHFDKFVLGVLVGRLVLQFCVINDLFGFSGRQFLERSRQHPLKRGLLVHEIHYRFFQGLEVHVCRVWQHLLGGLWHHFCPPVKRDLAFVRFKFNYGIRVDYACLADVLVNLVLYVVPCDLGKPCAKHRFDPKA